MSKTKSKIIQDGFSWVMVGGDKFLSSENYCETRDLFQAKTNHLLLESRTFIPNENISFLLTAIVGEIGNNSFDHNLGHWRDIPGIYFAANFNEKIIVIADRGQGVLATIKKVKPETKNDEEAIRVAFCEKVSGRAPEKRGNGLKFVKKIIEENSWELLFHSGNAVCQITKGEMKITRSGHEIFGTLAIIYF